MDRKPSRPRFLPLYMNRNNVVHSFKNSLSRYYIAWFISMLWVIMWKLKCVAFKGQQRAVMVMLLKKRVLCFIFTCSIFVTVYTMMRLTHKSSNLWNASLSEMLCLSEQKIYVDGRLLCENNQEMKYLSYQPPGGGWNNQRVAFENAVVLAKLLNRTLIVHPLAPHQEILRLKRKRKMSAGYEIYNMLPEVNLLPLSKVIDLKELSRLVPVKEVTSSHVEFLEKYKHLRWDRVCHNGLIGIWVDNIPKKTEGEKSKLLQRHMETNLPTPGDLPLYRRICKTELKHYGNTSFRPVWGIWDELSNRTEDMLYFSEGSLYIRELLFFDKTTVLNTHAWIMRFIRFAPDIRQRVADVLETMGHPFNALHVRRTDHPSSFNMKQEYWLQQLSVRDAVNLTKTLYIATDEDDKTWFRPFSEAGYNLFFAEDFSDQLRLGNENPAVTQDTLGLCEQLICAHADHFVGSYYSTFTMYIKRLRKQLFWKKGMLRKPYTSIVWAGTSDE